MDWALSHQLGIDPYVQIDFAGNPPIRTKVRHRRRQPLNVAFNQQFFLPVLLPSLGNSAKITIMDRDTLGSDDLVSESR
jgi:Ca2+-dependent lipid-binding protein